MDANQTAVSQNAGMSRSGQIGLVALLTVLLGGGVIAGPRLYHIVVPAAVPKPDAAAPAENTFKPNETQLAGLTIKPLEMATFRDERSADGKIAIDDDRNTPVYPPYGGRVTKVFVKAGDHVEAGAPLFTMDSTDLVQAQNDYITASAALAKSRSQVGLLGTAAKRQQALLAIEGAAQKDVQQAQADFTGAQNDQRSAEIALAAVRDRLHILGVPDATIRQLDVTRHTDPSLTIPAPIAGIITLRKLGAGQYLSAGASDPVITVGDLKLVWLTANVRETDAAMIRTGEHVDVRVTAFPDKVFKATISYVAPSVDPNTHRLPIRAEVDNSGALLKPEMFANFTIAVSAEHQGVAVPADAVIYDGDSARVWAVRPDGAMIAKPIKVGVTNGALLEALSGVAAGDNIVTKGSIFIDRAATED
jgi:cobalt-zinc-cadmium efflux system membrane fusion protein